MYGIGIGTLTLSVLVCMVPRSYRSIVLRFGALHR